MGVYNISKFQLHMFRYDNISAIIEPERSMMQAEFEWSKKHERPKRR